MDADGSDRDNPVRLTVNSFAENAPTGPPTVAGSSFRSNRDGNDEIYVMNADGAACAGSRPTRGGTWMRTGLPMVGRLPSSETSSQ